MLEGKTHEQHEKEREREREREREESAPNKPIISEETEWIIKKRFHQRKAITYWLHC